MSYSDPCCGDTIFENLFVFFLSLNHLQSATKGKAIHVFFPSVADKCASAVSAVITKSKLLIAAMLSINAWLPSSKSEKDRKVMENHVSLT